jgi:hypothetical protein
MSSQTLVKTLSKTRYLGRKNQTSKVIYFVGYNAESAYLWKAVAIEEKSALHVPPTLHKR